MFLLTKMITLVQLFTKEEFITLRQHKALFLPPCGFLSS